MTKYVRVWLKETDRPHEPRFNAEAVIQHHLKHLPLLDVKDIQVFENSEFDTCVHGVPFLPFSLKKLDDPRCKKCQSNWKGKCTSSIRLSKIAHIEGKVQSAVKGI